MYVFFLSKYLPLAQAQYMIWSNRVFVLRPKIEPRYAYRFYAYKKDVSTLFRNETIPKHRAKTQNVKKEHYIHVTVPKLFYWLEMKFVLKWTNGWWSVKTVSLYYFHWNGTAPFVLQNQCEQWRNENGFETTRNRNMCENGLYELLKTNFFFLNLDIHSTTLNLQKYKQLDGMGW